MTMQAAADVIARPPRNRFGPRVGGLALLVGGFILAGYFVHAAGSARVVEVVRGAGPWLPVVMAFELGLVTSDVVAMRVLLGGSARGVGMRVWVRSTTLAYASSVLMPAGRAIGEGVRAATLAPAIGGERAAGACARLQSGSLFGNAIVSAACAAGVAYATAESSLLPLLLVGNAVACAAVGLSVFAVVRNARIVAWIRNTAGRIVGRRAFPDAAAVAHAQSSSPRFATATATALAVGGRAVQTVEYALVLLAVGGIVTPLNAVTAQGIHLVGAAVGDLVPTQLGAMEGVYRAFASSLGFADLPARALSVALVVRIAQVTLALACLGIAAIAARHPQALSEERR